MKTGVDTPWISCRKMEIVRRKNMAQQSHEIAVPFYAFEPEGLLSARASIRTMSLLSVSPSS